LSIMPGIWSSLKTGEQNSLPQGGIDAARLTNEGILFVVAHVEVDYRKPAFYLDEVIVSTEIEQLTASSLHFRQKIQRDSAVLVEAKIVTVCVGEGMKPRRLPPFIREAL